MKPIGWIGLLLVVAGVVVLALGGFSYRKERESVSVGPVTVAAEKRAFVPAWVGVAAVVAGAALVFAGRRSGA